MEARNGYRHGVWWALITGQFEEDYVAGAGRQAAERAAAGKMAAAPAGLTGEVEAVGDRELRCGTYFVRQPYVPLVSPIGTVDAAAAAPAIVASTVNTTGHGVPQVGFR